MIRKIRKKRLHELIGLNITKNYGGNVQHLHVVTVRLSDPLERNTDDKRQKALFCSS